MTKAQYNKWLKSVEKRLHAFIEENKVTFVRNTVFNDDTEYILSDLPNIGRLRIFLESYDTAKSGDRKRVKIISIYCRFMDKLDYREVDSLSYMEHYNCYSGKYNWHTVCDTTMYIDVWFDTLLNDLNKIIRHRH